MQVIVNFAKPGVGHYQMILKPGEKLQFYRGRARRIPKDDETIFNTVPLKYITSIEIRDDSGKPLSVFILEKERFEEFKRLYTSVPDNTTFVFGSQSVLKKG